MPIKLRGCLAISIIRLYSFTNHLELKREESMKLRNGILALSLVSAFALPSTFANAADFYTPGPGGYKDGPGYVGVNWSGLYIGVNGGYGSTANTDSSVGDLNPSGGFAGGQIGYNWQGGFGLGRSWVFGIEADFQGGDISDSDAFGDRSRMNWFGTVRGRMGYAMGPTLFYATGGFAYGNVENGFPGFRVSQTQTGYVVGGGVEYKFNPAWSLKAEYQFISLDASDFNGPGALGAFERNTTEVNTVRVGVNYHFGSGYEPLK
jgi:outer membrane immunogenic protein